jgi:hypothetical protein
MADDSRDWQSSTDVKIGNISVSSSSTALPTTQFVYLGEATASCSGHGTSFTLLLDRIDAEELKGNVVSGAYVLLERSDSDYMYNWRIDRIDPYIVAPSGSAFYALQWFTANPYYSGSITTGSGSHFTMTAYYPFYQAITCNALEVTLRYTGYGAEPTGTITAYVYVALQQNLFNPTPVFDTGARVSFAENTVMNSPTEGTGFEVSNLGIDTLEVTAVFTLPTGAANPPGTGHLNFYAGRYSGSENLLDVFTTPETASFTSAPVISINRAYPLSDTTSSTAFKVDTLAYCTQVIVTAFGRGKPYYQPLWNT